jgi:hypothetical protein
MPDVRNEIIDNLQVRGSISGGGIQALAQAVRVAMTTSASVAGIQSLSNSNTDPGTASFSLEWEASIPTWPIASDAARFISKYVDLNNRMTAYASTTGALGLFVRIGGVTLLDVTSVVAANSASGRITTFLVSVVRETASTAGSVTFFADGIPVGSPAVIAAGSPSSYNISSAWFFGNGTSATSRFECTIKSAIIYNRALSASEVLSLYINGPALADMGASQTAVYTSDFSAGVDSWAGTSLTVAGNVDGIGGRDNVLSITCTSTGASETPRATRTIFPAEDINKPGEIKIALYRPSSNTTITGLRLNNSSGNGVFTNTSTADVFNTTAADTWEVFTVSGTMLGLTTSLRFSPVNSAGVRTQVSGEVIYVVDVTGKRLGVTGMWDAKDAQSDTGQIFDTSGNKNHAMLPASGATVLGKPVSEARQVRWTNTWTGTHELQYIGGVNQAVLPAKAYIESIVGIVSGATVEDIIIGDGSDTDRYVALTTGLAAGTVLFAMASRITDGTNLKLTVDPDANATMSIIWTVTYRILE